MTSVASLFPSGVRAGSTRSDASCRRAGRRRAGRPQAGLLAVVGAVALLATACGGGPGSQEDFNEILTRGGSISDSEADCISTAVFDEYADDENALGKLSSADDLEFLYGPEGVAGFEDFFDSTVAGCLQVGPSN